MSANQEIQTFTENGQQLSLVDMQNHVALIDSMAKSVMKEDMHYGKIPGCGSKPTLLLPGAQKLVLAFQLAVDPEVEITDHPDEHREYAVRCVLTHMGTGRVIGIGTGVCSTRESRYRFRTNVTDQEVPKEYWEHRDPALLGGNQYRTKKVDGTWFIVEKIEHDNPTDYYNTCLKIAKKRALVDGVLTATAASDHFTQDIEDDPELHKSSAPASQKKATSRPASGEAGERINFGKHRGQLWSEVPNDYIDWCIKNAQKDHVRDAAQAEMDRRTSGEGSQVDESEGQPAGPTDNASESDIRAIRQKLKDCNMELLPMLDALGLLSIHSIQAQHVQPIIKYIDDPSVTPALADL